MPCQQIRQSPPPCHRHSQIYQPCILAAQCHLAAQQIRIVQGLRKAQLLGRQEAKQWLLSQQLSLQPHSQRLKLLRLHRVSKCQIGLADEACLHLSHALISRPCHKLHIPQHRNSPFLP